LRGSSRVLVLAKFFAERMPGGSGVPALIGDGTQRRKKKRTGDYLPGAIGGPAVGYVLKQKTRSAERVFESIICPAYGI
jgi:hypothetical protein